MRIAWIHIGTHFGVPRASCCGVIVLKHVLLRHRTCVLIIVAYIAFFRIGSMLVVRFVNYQKR